MTLAKRWPRQDDFDASIRLAAQAYSVPLPLIKGIIAVESGFNPLAYNGNDPGGAWGLMQMIPQTARGLGYNGPMQDLQQNPHLAIDLGTRLLGQNLQRAGGVVADSVSAYNGGFRPSLGYGGVRANGTYANQAYVNNVLAATSYFQAYEASKTGAPVTIPAGGTGGVSVPFPPDPGAPAAARGFDCPACGAHFQQVTP